MLDFKTHEIKKITFSFELLLFEYQLQVTAFFSRKHLSVDFIVLKMWIHERVVCVCVLPREGILRGRYEFGLVVFSLSKELNPVLCRV